MCVGAILILLCIIFRQNQSPCKLVMYIPTWLVGAAQPLATIRVVFIDWYLVSDVTQFKAVCFNVMVKW